MFNKGKKEPAPPREKAAAKDKSGKKALALPSFLKKKEGAPAKAAPKEKAQKPPKEKKSPLAFLKREPKAPKQEKQKAAPARQQAPVADGEKKKGLPFGLKLPGKHAAPKEKPAATAGEKKKLSVALIGVLGAVAVGALVYFVVLPRLGGGGAPDQALVQAAASEAALPLKQELKQLREELAAAPEAGKAAIQEKIDKAHKRARLQLEMKQNNGEVPPGTVEAFDALMASSPAAAPAPPGGAAGGDGVAAAPVPEGAPPPTGDGQSMPPAGTPTETPPPSPAAKQPATSPPPAPAREAPVQKKEADADFALFLEAIKDGNIDEVRRLLDEGHDVNASDQGGRTPLYVAMLFLEAVFEGPDIVRLLIERGADVNVAVPPVGTPLLLAADSGRRDLVRMLVERGAEVNVEDSDGYTPLMYAIMGEYDKIAFYLRRHGAEDRPFPEKEDDKKKKDAGATPPPTP